MKTLTLKAVLDRIPEVIAFIEEQLEAVGCPMKAQMQIDMAVDELFSNIAHYAYGKGTGDATVIFDYDPETRTISVTFEDAGVAYDPLKKDDPDVSLPVSEREVGGLGIFLVKKTMDAMEYERRDQRNRLTIRKKI